MHSGMNFNTVLGDISYDKKGDITKLDYVMYIWKKDAERQDHLRANARIPAARCRQRLARRVDVRSPPLAAGFFSELRG